MKGGFMTKTYNKDEFNDMLKSALMKLVDQAKDQNCNDAVTGLMLTGFLILSEIRYAVFDDNTETVTIEKE